MDSYEGLGVAATPPGHSDEPASGLTAIAGSVPNTGTIWRAMWRRAGQRAEWLDALPIHDPVRALAVLENTAACFLSRQTSADREAMHSAIGEARMITDAAFHEWCAGNKGGA
jgi:hypothetical protein